MSDVAVAGVGDDFGGVGKATSPKLEHLTLTSTSSHVIFGTSNIAKCLCY
jgi:hypothetical protein